MLGSALSANRPVTANPMMLAKALRQREAFPRPQLDTPQKTLDFGAGLLGMVPGVGDAIGLAADAHRFATEPQSRTWPNYGLSLAGMLPGIPPLSAMVWRGGKAPSKIGFFSRDQEYARGFDKGDFRKYDVAAESGLDMNKTYSAEQLQPIIQALRDEGDESTARAISQVLKEDGGAIGSHVYTWIEKLSGVSPERVISRAGFDVIDTGRDLRVLNPAVVSY